MTKGLGSKRRWGESEAFMKFVIYQQLAQHFAEQAWSWRVGPTKQWGSQSAKLSYSGLLSKDCPEWAALHPQLLDWSPPTSHLPHCDMLPELSPAIVSYFRWYMSSFSSDRANLNWLFDLVLSLLAEGYNLQVSMLITMLVNFSPPEGWLPLLSCQVPDMKREALEQLASLKYDMKMCSVLHSNLCQWNWPHGSDLV